MRICHVSSAHPRYDNRILKRECVSLASAGYEVAFIVNDDKEDEIFQNVKIISTEQAFGESRIKRFISGVNKVYRKALEIDADIYHLHDPELLLIASSLKRKGKKVIFDSHEAYAEQIRNKTYIPKILRRLVAAFYLKYETYISNKIDAVIVPSRIEESGLDYKLSFENRSKLVGYVNNYPRNEELNYKDRKFSADKRTICYSGGLTYERGIEHLAAAARIASAKLLLAGNFSSGEFKKKIMGMAEDESIVYYGFLNGDELSEFYRESKIGMCTLLPIGQYHKMSNLPTKTYEYMGMGLPLIISDFPYNRAFLEKYPVGLLVDPENEKDIAEKIEYLFSHSEEAEEMGRLGREIFLKNYNWAVAEKELLEIYKKIE